MIDDEEKKKLIEDQIMNDYPQIVDEGAKG
jgi:hypothetical protein